MQVRQHWIPNNELEEDRLVRLLAKMMQSVLVDEPKNGQLTLQPVLSSTPKKSLAIRGKEELDAVKLTIKEKAMKRKRNCKMDQLSLF